MEKTITLDDASKIFGFDNYDYSQVDGGILATIRETGEPFDIIYPDRLPVGRDGSLFIPGIDCYERNLLVDPHFITDAGLRLHQVGLDIATGIYYPANTEVGIVRPRFRIADPREAAHTVVVIDYDSQPDSTVPLLTPESDFGCKLHVVAAWRLIIGEGADSYAQDYVIFDKNATMYCAATYNDMIRWIDGEIVAGEVFMATYEESKSVYRKYLENVLLPKLTPLSTGSVMRTELGDDDCRIWYGCFGEPDQLIDVFDYTLEGVQKFARFLK